MNVTGLSGKKNNIVIIGAGIGGLTLARRLSLSGQHPEVYEANPHLKPAGGGLIVPPNSARILESLGLGEVFARSVPLTAMQIFDAGGSLLYRREQADVRQKYGHGLWGVSREVLHAALLHSLPDEHIFTGYRLEDVRSMGHQSYVTFGNRRHVTGDLLVAADGAASRVREVLFPEIQLQPTGQTTLRGVADMPLPGHYARTFTEFWGAGMRFTCFPLSERQTYWHAVLKSQNVLGTPTTGEVAQMYEHFPHPVKELISASSNPLTVTELRDLSPLPNWSRGNVVLLGDAAHATSPHLAQGAAQAVEDAATLGELLVTESDPLRAMRRYQALREGHANAVVARSRQMGQIGQASGAARFFRNLTLKISPELARSRIEAFYE